MTSLTIDVMILMSASEKGDPDHYEESAALLNLTHDCKSAKVVLDDENIIESHYVNKVTDPLAVGRRWLAHMLASGKFEKVRRIRNPSGIRAELRKAKFPPENEDFMKYCRAAAASSSKRLVTHDSDYDDAKKRRVLRRCFGLEINDAIVAARAVHDSCSDPQCTAIL